MTNKPDESHMIEFLERECRRAGVAVEVAEAEHNAWAARLAAAYDEVTRRREALAKRRKDTRPAGLEPAA